MNTRCAPQQNPAVGDAVVHQRRLPGQTGDGSMKMTEKTENTSSKSQHTVDDHGEVAVGQPLLAPPPWSGPQWPRLRCPA